jgi:hypothetical protein
MAVKKMVVHCSCHITMCDHAKEEVGNMLQDTYDDAYDEGWTDAFTSVRETLVDMGFDKASKMSTPPPPPRKRSRSSSREDSELLN